MPERLQLSLSHRWRGVCAGLAVSVAVLLPLQAKLPNIVLVMADDQGWGDMVYNGHPHLQTPHFDAMAREGIRFDRFYAASPVCSPTRASVLTGRTPNRTGVLQWGHPLRPQEITLAEQLKKAGYRTGHFGKWHLGSVQRESATSPGAFGFDEWISAPNFFDLDPILSNRGKAVQFVGDSSDVTVEVALDFIRKSAEDGVPFFAVVWFGSPHSPFEALEADAEAYAEFSEDEKNFYGEITAMDRAFGRLRNELRELGLRDNSLLWYCSDNGALPRVGSSGGHRGLKNSVYEGGLLVPALLEWPGRMESPRVISTPSVTSDIYPTILEIAGVVAEEGQPVLDGISLMPLLEGETEERSAPIGVWHYPTSGIRIPSKQWMEDLHAAQGEGGEPEVPERFGTGAGKIRLEMAEDRFPGHASWLQGSWKLHRIQDAKSEQVSWELYDLAADPGEGHDLFEEHPERVEEMKQDLESWLAGVVASHNGGDY